MINFLKRFLLYFVIILIINLLFQIIFSLSTFFSDPIAVLNEDIVGLIFLPFALALFFALTAIRTTWTMDKGFFEENEDKIREQILKFPFHQRSKNEYKLDLKKEFLLKGDIQIAEKENFTEINGPSFYINQLKKQFEIS